MQPQTKALRTTDLNAPTFPIEQRCTQIHPMEKRPPDWRVLENQNLGTGRVKHKAVFPQVYNYIWHLGAVILGTQDQRAPRTIRAQVEPRESALDAASPVTLSPSSSISGRCPHAHRNGT